MKTVHVAMTPSHKPFAFMITATMLGVLLLVGYCQAGCLNSKSAGRECTAGQKAIVVGSLAAVADTAGVSPWWGAGAGVAGIVAREAHQGSLGSNDSNWDIGGAVLGGVVVSLLLSGNDGDEPQRFQITNQIADEPVSLGLTYRSEW